MLSAITPITVLTAVAVFYGIAWLVMNLYNYYPVARAGVERVITGEPNTEVSFVGTKAIEFSESGTYPEIDVFVPAYDEADVIHQSIKSIRNTAYPQEKLSLTVLLEPDDDATIARVKELATEIDLDLVVVPEEYPGSPNKPRALNYGFEHTDGKIVGIIDAENVVSENLFDRVSKAIVAEQHDYVQGMVDMVNEDDGWKNMLFRAEYGYWYRIILPAFKRLGFPIPLSGTTCFFRRDLLESISAQRIDRKGDPWDSDDASWIADHGLSGITPWDPTNVTEDFELGLQLWCSECSFGIIESVTKEESPKTLKNWMKQRTRWQKGKIFTFFDFFRHSAGESRRQRGHLLWQSFLPHAGPLNVSGLFLLIGVGTYFSFIPQHWLVRGILLFASMFLLISAIAFAIGYWCTSDKSPVKRSMRGLLVLITVPGYWILQWAADIRAFKQLAVGDLGWEKTVHEDAGRLEQLQTEPEETDSLVDVVRNRAVSHVLLAPILLLALALRIPGINRSFWVDEVYTVTERGQMGMTGIITTGSDPHPPLYYMFMHGWMDLFGNSEVAVRSLSVLFGLASIVAVYLLAMKLYDKRTGQIAALLMSISWFQIQHALTARMYTMLVTFSVLSLFFYVRALEDHSVDNRLGYALTTVAMLLTHVYGAFVVLAQLIHLSYKLISWADITRVKKWAMTQTMAFSFFAPWIVLVALPNYVFTSTDETEVRWLTAPTLDTLEKIALAYAGAPVNYPQVNITDFGLIIGRIFAIVAVVAVIWHLYTEQKTGGEISGAKLLGSLIVCFTLIPFVVSVTVIPLLEARYTIVGFVAVAILIAKTISDVDYRPVQIVMLLVVVAAIGSMLPTAYATTPSEEWDEVATLAEEEIDESTLIVHNPGYVDDSFSYYFDEKTSTEVDSIRWTGTQRESKLDQQLSEKDYDTVAVVNIHGQNLGAVNESLPAKFVHEDTHSFDVIKLVVHENTTESSTAQQREVAP